MLDVCDPETRKNCATLKESLMDIDSNFDDDYNSINALKSKKKKKEPSVKLKKKVTFDCADDDSCIEGTFDYEHEDVNESDEELNESDEDVNESDEDMSNEEFEDENLSDEECIDESMSDEEHFGSDREEEFDYDHEEKNSSEEDCSDNEFDEHSIDDNFISNKKTKILKEDIYGRIRKPDGTVVVSIFYFTIAQFILINDVF